MPRATTRHRYADQVVSNFNATASNTSNSNPAPDTRPKAHCTAKLRFEPGRTPRIAGLIAMRPCVTTVLAASRPVKL